MFKVFKTLRLELVFILSANMFKVYSQRISENWCFTVHTPHYCALNLRKKFTKAAGLNCTEIILRRFPSGEDYIIQGFAKFREGVHKSVVETAIDSHGSIVCIEAANKQHFYRRIQKYT